MATSTSSDPQQPRQNANPDIQDIITGIVKLLNGNVNIHTNSQLQQQQQQLASRKPYPSRINNRGPPRISEAQPLPNDFDQIPPPISTHRPGPYPFDRPNLDNNGGMPGINRPFINGVPLPEQVVPSMQSNYRPGFISQNRPPWQRPRPRPPIPGHRRPIPPYKPIPATMPEYRPEDDPQLTATLEVETNGPLLASDSQPTDSSGSYEPSGYGVDEDLNQNEEQSIEPTSVEVVTSTTTTTTTKAPSKKEDITKKKDKTKNTGEKKTPSTEPSLTTVLQSKAEVNTHQYISLSATTTTTTTTTTITTLVSSTDYPTTEASTKLEPTAALESSFAEITTLPESSTTAIVTPTLQTHTPSSTQMPQHQQPTMPPPTAGYRPYGVPPPATTPTENDKEPYHPRPGIVLDDPEFKPGGSGRHPQHHHHQRQPQQPPVQPTRPVTPPGYGEIFDVTLSAIQGPGGGGGGKQTFKIGAYGGGGGGNGDIIISANGDDGFVSIDGKRTYLNLFGESTETETVPAAAPVAASTTRHAQLPTIVPTTLAAASIDGAPASSSIRATQQQQAVCP